MDGRVELTEMVRENLPAALIALDFDGTLSPLVDDPEQSRLAPGGVEALTALGDAGAHVAVVTGRDATTVLRLSGLGAVRGLRVHGLYGAEHWHAGKLETLPDQPVLAEAREFLRSLLARTHAADGVWVEDKRLSLVLQARTVADSARALGALRADVDSFADRTGLEVHPGRDVLELRLPGYDKGRVLRDLVDEVEPGVLVYAGDDLGDLPAFAVVAELRRGGRAAWSVAAGDPPLPEVLKAADMAVAGPGELIELLTSMTASSATPTRSGPVT